MGQERRNHLIGLGPRPNHMAANPVKLAVRNVSFWYGAKQAARISQRVAFFHLGELVEAGDTQAIFVAPRTKRCADFVTGRYG